MGASTKLILKCKIKSEKLASEESYGGASLDKLPLYKILKLIPTLGCDFILDKGSFAIDKSGNFYNLYIETDRKWFHWDLIDIIFYYLKNFIIAEQFENIGYFCSDCDNIEYDILFDKARKEIILKRNGQQLNKSDYNLDKNKNFMG